jgi:hypothetical protein
MKKVGFKGTEPCVAKNKEEKMRNIARRKKQRGGGCCFVKLPYLNMAHFFFCLGGHGSLLVYFHNQRKDKQVGGTIARGNGHKHSN